MESKHNFCIFTLVLHTIGVYCVESDLFRTTSSVDVQVCAPSVLANERESIKGVIESELKTILSNTGVYYARTYTTSSGGVCFLFVFQASSPNTARNSVPVLVGDNGILNIQYDNSYVSCTIEAVPWSGIENTLGLPWSWTGQDILMWGSCTGVLLVICVVSSCCYLQLSLSKEKKRAQALLDQDSQMLSSLKMSLKKMHATSSKV